MPEEGLNLASILFPIAGILVLLIIALGFSLYWGKTKEKGRITSALNFSLFLVTLPREVKKQEIAQPKNEKELIAVMEQLYASLASFRERGFSSLIYGQPYLVFEIATPHIGEEINFYIACPTRYEAVMEKLIHSFYPNAQIDKVEDYNIFNPIGSSAATHLMLAKSHILPFRTYQKLESDPLKTITNTLSKLEEEGEGAAVQIVLRPIKPNWRRRSLKVAKLMQTGKSFEEARKSTTLLGGATKAFNELSTKPKPQITQQQQTLKQLTPLHEETIKALEGKASRTGFEVNIRLLTSAANKQRAQQIMQQLESAYMQFSDPSFNSLKPRRDTGRALKKIVYYFSFRMFNKRHRIILNTEELTSLFHFPNIELETPKIKTLKAKPSTPPANLPTQGIIIGKNIYRGEEVIVRLQENDRRRHLYVVGQTGTGKSVLMEEMIRQDIENGKGVGVLDPHGELVEKVLALIPKERAEDVILINPADLELPIGLNMLEYDPKYPEQKTFIVNELINIFDKLYDLRQTGGPMFEQYTRNALQLLMDDPAEQATLMDVPRVLADASYRKRLLQKCKNIIVKDFWEKEAEKAGGDVALQNITPYITSKFNIFIANDYMRPIIGQAKSGINFKDAINNKKILLVNLSKGRLGEINSSLLGLVTVGKILMAAFARIDMPEDQRQDFYLYIDEFQSFATESISIILSEARKYKLNLSISHQFIGQLHEKIRDAVFGNVGSIVCFRIGAEDAEFLVKQFAPIFDQNDLINIDNYNAYVKLLISGATSRPFNIQTFPPKKGNPEIGQAIKELSRLKYGRDRNLVENEIMSRLRPEPYGAGSDAATSV